MQVKLFIVVASLCLFCGFELYAAPLCIERLRVAKYLPVIADDKETSESLMSQMRGGQGGAAFVELVARYNEYVKLFVAALSKNVEPEDIAQEVWLTVFQDRDSFTEETNFLFWLQMITRNRVVDAARAHKRLKRGGGVKPESLETAFEDETFQILLVDENAPAPPSVLEKKEAWAHLTAAIATLPKDHRDLLHLRHVEELGPTAIGNVYGRTKKWAVINLGKAESSMRAALHHSWATGAQTY